MSLHMARRRRRLKAAAALIVASCFASLLLMACSCLLETEALSADKCADEVAKASSVAISAPQVPAEKQPLAANAQQSFTGSRFKRRAPRTASNGAVKRRPILNEFAFPSNLIQGMRFVLMCQVLDGDLPLDIRWLRDGRELSPNSDESRQLDLELATLDSLGSSILFRSVQLAQAGNYTCLAANDAGRAAYSAQMSVKVPPKWRLEPKEQIEATIGMQITIDCQASGNPSPFIRWKFATGANFGQTTDSETSIVVAAAQQAQQETYDVGANSVVQTSSLLGQMRLVTSNQHVQTLENGSLSIRAATKDDEGAYMCEADNGVGAPIARLAQLAVHQQAAFADDVQLLEPASNSGLSSATSVLVAASSSSVQQSASLTSVVPVRAVRLGAVAQLRLLCQPLGELPLTVDWFKDGRHIYSTNTESNGQSSANGRVQQADSSQLQPAGDDSAGRVHVNTRRSDRRHNGLESELIVTQLRRTDAGVYQCAARNTFGAADRRLQLIVQEPPAPPDTVDVAHISSRSVALRWLAPFDGHAPITKYLVEYRKIPDPHSPQQLQHDKEVPLSVSERLVASPATAVSIATVSAQAPSTIGELVGHHQITQISQQQHPVQHSVLDLEPLTRYSMRVVAVNVAGRSRPSVALSLRTEEEVPSVVPIDVEATVLSSRTIKLAWKTQFSPQNELVDGFFVGYRSLDSSSSSANSIPAGPIAVTAAGAAPAAAPTTFTYKTVRLTQTSSSTTTDLQRQSNAATDTASTFLSPVSSVTKTQPSQQMVPNNKQLVVVVVHSFEFVVGGLSKNTEYTFLIQCFNRKGAGPTSEPLIVRTFASDPPEKLVLSADEVTESSVKVKWAFLGRAQPESDEQVEGFVLSYTKIARNFSISQHQLKSQQDVHLVIGQQQQQNHPRDHTSLHHASVNSELWHSVQLAPASRSHLLADLDCGSSYALKMYAFNKVGKGEQSDVLTTTTWGKAPIAPDKRSFLSVNSTLVKLHLGAWYGAGCDIDNFVVKYRLRRRRLSPSAGGSLVQSRQSQHEWHLVSSNIVPEQQTVQIQDLAPATSYELLVTATNSVGATDGRFKFTTLTSDGRPATGRSLLGLMDQDSNGNNSIDDDDDDDDRLESLGADGASLVRDFSGARSRRPHDSALRRFVESPLALAAGAGVLLAAAAVLVSRALVARLAGDDASGTCNSGATSASTVSGPSPHSGHANGGGQSSASSLSSACDGGGGGFRTQQQQHPHQYNNQDSLLLAAAASDAAAAVTYGELGAPATYATAFCAPEQLAAADIFANYAQPTPATTAAENHRQQHHQNNQQQLVQMLMLHQAAAGAESQTLARYPQRPASAKLCADWPLQSPSQASFAAVANKPHAPQAAYAATLAGYRHNQSHHNYQRQQQHQQQSLAGGYCAQLADD